MLKDDFLLNNSMIILQCWFMSVIGNESNKYPPSLIYIWVIELSKVKFSKIKEDDRKAKTIATEESKHLTATINQLIDPYPKKKGIKGILLCYTRDEITNPLQKSTRRLCLIEKSLPRKNLIWSLIRFNY